MGSYPYSRKEHFPEDDSTLEYQLWWNDRFETGDAAQSYRFDYLPRHAAPMTPPPAN
jgi:hypothetical protein